MAIVIIVIIVVFILEPVGCTSSSCPTSLHFSDRVYFDDTQTFSLRICCNITRLWMGRVTDDWTVTPVPGLQWLPVDNLTMPGFDLLVSRCGNDRPYVLGELVGRGCHYRRGHIVTLTKSAERLPEFDQWYVTCFEMSMGDRSAPCKICKLEMYCTHQRRCKEKFLQREIVNASLTTITIVVNVGNLPFDDADILTEITQTTPNNNNNNNSGNNKNTALSAPLTHYTNTAKATRNRTIKYEVEGLKLNTWYQISTCAIVRTPSWFRRTYTNISLPAEEKFCLDIEGYRTSRPRTTSGTQVLRVCFLRHIVLVFLSTFIMYSAMDGVEW